MKKKALKRLLSGFLVAIFFLVVIAPTEASAAPPWWNRFKEIVKADASGAVLGAQITGTLGGAIGGAVVGSIAAGTDSGEGGSGWTGPEDVEASVGLLHNLGLNKLYAWGRSQQRLDSEGTVYSWGRNHSQVEQDDETPPAISVIMEHLADYDLDADGVETFLKSMDPSFEEIMRRIKEATTRQSNDDGLQVSDNFFNNLERALAILDKDADDPNDLIEESARFFLESSSKESGEELSKMMGGPSFTNVEIVYKPQGIRGVNNDIILAAIYADVLRSSYSYWTNDCDDSDVCVLPEFQDLDSDGDGIPDAVEIDREIVLTLDQATAFVNGQAIVMDTPAFVESGRTLVPFRFIGEQLGAEIGWDNDERKATYQLDDNIIELWIGQSRAMINGIETTVDQNPAVTPVIVNSRTMVPVRFISEALGFEVSWNPETRQATILKQIDKATPKLYQ